MNKKAIITVLLALISLGANAQLASVKELSMQSEYFGFERQVLIYMPNSTRLTMMSSMCSTRKTAQSSTWFTA